MPEYDEVDGRDIKCDEQSDTKGDRHRMTKIMCIQSKAGALRTNNPYGGQCKKQRDANPRHTVSDRVEDNIKT